MPLSEHLAQVPRQRPHSIRRCVVFTTSENIRLVGVMSRSLNWVSFRGVVVADRPWINGALLLEGLAR